MFTRSNKQKEILILRLHDREYSFIFLIVTKDIGAVAAISCFSNYQ